MKRVFVASALLLVALNVSNFAFAADTPVYFKTPTAGSSGTPTAGNSAAPLSWSGFYIGGNVGYGFGQWDTVSNQHVFNFESLTASPNVNGVLGGLQAGYIFRNNSGPFVVGVETDMQLNSQRNSINWSDHELPVFMPPPPPVIVCPPNSVLQGNTCVSTLRDFVPRAGGQASLSSDWESTWLGTARVRAGYTPNSNTMIYVTGGAAFGAVEYKFNFSQPGAAQNVPTSPTNYSLTTNQTRIGFAVGAGTEIKLEGNWSAKFEYLYVDLGTASIDTTDIDGQPFHVAYRIHENIARVGLNYAFK